MDIDKIYKEHRKGATESFIKRYEREKHFDHLAELIRYGKVSIKRPLKKSYFFKPYYVCPECIKELTVTRYRSPQSYSLYTYSCSCGYEYGEDEQLPNR